MEMWQDIGLFQTFHYSPELCENWKMALSDLWKSGMHPKKEVERLLTSIPGKLLLNNLLFARFATIPVKFL
jgi:hypothetical protein